jgi:hypothetical protein
MASLPVCPSFPLLPPLTKRAKTKGFGVWYVISRDNTAGDKKTIINQPAIVITTTTPAPIDYGPSFHMTTILQGISTRLFGTKEAKVAPDDTKTLV